MTALPPALLESGPLVVGATGGSGTRVVAQILREAGLFTGTELNESEDAVRLGEYSDRWINAYLGYTRGLPPWVGRDMTADLGRVLADHCAPLAGEARPWGWKEPRSIFLLPYLHRHLPALRFLHVVRDGRDMALSSNQNQLRKHADAAGIPQDLPPPARSIALWSWVNLRAAFFGAELLGARYSLIRFEDMCARPVEIAREVLAFAGLDGDAAAAAEQVEPRESLGRWRREDAETVVELERLGGDALQRFGYETATA